MLLLFTMHYSWAVLYCIVVQPILLKIVFIHYLNNYFNQQLDPDVPSKLIAKTLFHMHYQQEKKKGTIVSPHSNTSKVGKCKHGQESHVSHPAQDSSEVSGKPLHKISLLNSRKFYFPARHNAGTPPNLNIRMHSPTVEQNCTSYCVPQGMQIYILT